MPKNTLDLAMLITDEILNEFESKGVLHIPIASYSMPASYCIFSTTHSVQVGNP